MDCQTRKPFLRVSTERGSNTYSLTEGQPRSGSCLVLPWRRGEHIALMILASHNQWSSHEAGGQQKGWGEHTVLTPSWPCRELQGAPPGVAILLSSVVLVWRTRTPSIPAQQAHPEAALMLCMQCSLLEMGWVSRTQLRGDRGNGWVRLDNLLEVTRQTRLFLHGFGEKLPG